MNANHWNQLFRSWSNLKTPRRVPDAVIAAIDGLIAGVPGPTLMLGVTHGLAELGSDLTAFDRSEALVRAQWPGNTPNRRAVVGDWLAPPFAAGAFATCIGDGVINSLRFPGQIGALLTSLARIIRSNGLFICRVFTAPEQGETVSAVVRAVWQGDVKRFQTLKFQLAMAIGAEQGNANVPVQETYRAFAAHFADRDRLAAATGWERKEIDTIDVYAASTVAYCFPTQRACLAVVPDEFVNARFVFPQNYDMAERYPLLVAERR